jgi:hypothetical protein
MTFNPKEHITKIKGKDYLEVKWRVAWLRDENPLWAINTDVFEIAGAVVCKAIISDENGNLIASGMATVREASKQEFTWSGREFEKAETAAIGRALAHAGYGTQFCGDEMDEGDYIADSPVKKQPPQSNSKPQAEPQFEDYWQPETVAKVLEKFNNRFPTEHHMKVMPQLEGDYKKIEDFRDASHFFATMSEWCVGARKPIALDHVRYVVRGKQKYLQFQAPIELRAYGRSTTFKELLGDTYTALRFDQFDGVKETTEYIELDFPLVVPEGGYKRGGEGSADYFTVEAIAQDIPF